MMVTASSYSFKVFGAGAVLSVVCCLAQRGSTGDSLQIISGVVCLPSDLKLPRNTLYLSSPRH